MTEPAQIISWQVKTSEHSNGLWQNTVLCYLCSGFDWHFFALHSRHVYILQVVMQSGQKRLKKSAFLRIAIIWSDNFLLRAIKESFLGISPHVPWIFHCFKFLQKYNGLEILIPGKTKIFETKVLITFELIVIIYILKFRVSLLNLVDQK